MPWQGQRTRESDSSKFGDFLLANILVDDVFADRRKARKLDAGEISLRVRPPDGCHIRRLRPASVVPHTMAAIHLGMRVVSCGIGGKLACLVGRTLVLHSTRLSPFKLASLEASQ